MSNEIPTQVSASSEKILKGDPVYINDCLGKLQIGVYVFNYRDILPIVEHYVRGGLFGHAPNFCQEEDFQAIRDFIGHVSKFTEVQVKGVIGGESNTDRKSVV